MPKNTDSGFEKFFNCGRLSKPRWYHYENIANSQEKIVFVPYVLFDTKAKCPVIPYVNIDTGIYKQLYTRFGYIKKVVLQDNRKGYLVKLNKKYYSFWKLCTMIQENVNNRLFSLPFDELQNCQKGFDFLPMKLEKGNKIDTLIKLNCVNFRIVHNANLKNKKIGGGGV